MIADEFVVINDLHCGVERAGGTTPASSQVLRAWTHEEHARLLALAGPTHVIVNGDLTDAFDIPLHDALAIFSVSDNFLASDPNARLTWLLGNHDLSKDSSKMGTVCFVAWLLALRYPDRFTLVTAPQFVGNGVYAIPHLTNQTMFDEALAAVPDGVKYLLLHCNFDNSFAGERDHSLNLERAVVKGFRDRGITTILGHEHLGRDAFGGKLIVVGNQFPTSVADCLGGGDTLPHKRMLRVRGDEVEFVLTWLPEGAHGYFEADWKNLDNVPEASFVRVSGTASAEQAADVIRAVSALRQRSKAFVITNAVKIAQIEGMGELADSVEDVREVDVIEMLIETLNPEQQAAVRKLRAPKEVEVV